jgi:hypothetical protein
MTQTLNDLLTILQALGLIALYWGSAPAAIAVAVGIRKRARVRYHVGNPHSPLPAQTFRTKGQAVRASVEAYRETGRCHRVTMTR